MQEIISLLPRFLRDVKSWRLSLSYLSLPPRLHDLGQGIFKSQVYHFCSRREVRNYQLGIFLLNHTLLRSPDRLTLRQPLPTLPMKGLCWEHHIVVLNINQVDDANDMVIVMMMTMTMIITMTMMIMVVVVVIIYECCCC